MIIDFQQGIITYPASGSIQRFLGYSGGYVTLRATDGQTDLSFAHGSENYLHTESTDVPQAWGPIEPSTDAWLYFDLDLLTATRTFGITYVQPGYGDAAPSAPVADQHWFDTSSRKMMVYRGGKWINKVRLFACKINNGIFSPLGSNTAMPYAGTQVGITAAGIITGRIIVDDTGAPIRRQNGLLFTTEDEFFVNGSPINTIRLESNVLNGTAKENIARYQVVKFTEFGKVNLATYDDEQTTAIAMSMEDINQGQPGTLCMQGVITNSQWSWASVGAALWVHGSIPGLLVEYDPHVVDAAMYPVGKPPVARVLTPTSIFFDQGLGGKGDKGDQSSALVPLATTTIFGVSKLSVPAANTSNPIVVGDNDPRNSNDRNPLPHNQSAATITTTPVGVLTGSNVQEDLQIINDSFVKKAGDTMTGPLTLNGSPSNNLHATTKQYVDTRTLNDLADVVIASPVVEDVLKYDGTGWINGPGQSAQLWTVGSRTQHTDWVPATSSISVAASYSYGQPFPSMFALEGASIYIPTSGLDDAALTFSVSVDGTTHAYVASPADVATVNNDSGIRGLVSVLSTFLSTIDVSLALYVTAESSGFTLTSTSPAVTTISVVSTALLSSTGGFSNIQVTSTPGTALSNVAVTPILTPSAHQPAFAETYIPLHTTINSNPPDTQAPFWLAAVSDTATIGAISATTSALVAYGSIATANVPQPVGKVVYVVGSHYTPGDRVDAGVPTGITLEARDAVGTTGNAGRVLGVADGFAGRVHVPVIPNGFTPYTITPAGVAVGPSGDVYTLAGITSITIGSEQSIAVISCVSSDLNTVKWQQTINLGYTNAIGDTWLTEPRSGLSIHNDTNTIYAALPVVQDAMDGEIDGQPLAYRAGMLLVSINATTGSVNWQLMESDHGVWYEMQPTGMIAETAVHQATGDVYVAYNTVVLKVSNTGGILWKQKVRQADVQAGRITSGLTVDQQTGDVFVAVDQEQNNNPPES